MIGKAISHYRIIEKLGQGGMGEVFLAHDTALNRKVALKFLPDIFSGDPERLARFEREARLLASLNHPNIATIYGLEQADGKQGTQAWLAANAKAGDTNIKVSSVSNISVGDKIRMDIDSVGYGIETVTVTKVGTAGATTASTATAVGATVIPVAGGMGFAAGQTITIDSGANQETAVIASTGRGVGPGGGRGGPGGATITVTAPLKSAHEAGAQVSGTGITLTRALTNAHDSGAQVAGNVPTPGAPNQYYRKVASAKK